MKKLLLFILLAVAAGFAYWPYQATGKFRDAVNADDRKALDEIVDWPALRDSVRNQLQSNFERVLKEKNPNQAPITPAQSAWIAKNVGAAVEARLVAENFAKDFKKRPGNFTEKPDVENVEITNRTWVSATEFTMRTNVDSTDFRFRLNGLGGWKLVAMDLSSADFDTSVKPLFQAAAPKAPVAGSAPPMANPTPAKSEQWIFKGYKNPLDQRPSGGQSGQRGGR